MACRRQCVIGSLCVITFVFLTSTCLITATSCREQYLATLCMHLLSLA
jgi:hypothetical protein